MVRQNPRAVRLLVASVFLAEAAILGGQSAAPTSEAPLPTPAPPADLRIYLMDGSVVSGKLSVDAIDIDTAFGALKVPLDQIRSLTPGLQSHPDFNKKLTDLVNDLSGDNYTDREKAEQALLKMGPEIEGELLRQQKSADAEKQTRLQKILDDFDSRRESDEDVDSSAGWNRDDMIVTNSFTIVGRITTASFAVNSPYGTLQLKLSDLRRMQRDSAEPLDLRKNLTVSGTTIAQHEFQPLSTRIKRGDKISITATGTITMTPFGRVPCTPDGARNFGTVQPGNIPTGALIAKIGNGGTQFKVGSTYNFTADQSGILQFGVALPGDYGSFQFPGEYQVKIRILRK